MSDKSLEDLEKEIDEKKAQQLVEVKRQEQSYALQEKMNDTMMGLMDSVVDKNKDEMLNLTDKAFKNELEIRETQTEGRKKKEKSKVEKEITEAKTEEDQAKHERAKTILKGFGFVTQLPTPYRITALIIGFPIVLAYLCSLGAITLFLTFVIKGFITMVADCAERFAEVNKKFIENDNEKDFKLGKAMVNILKWILIVGAIVAVVVLLIVR